MPVNCGILVVDKDLYLEVIELSVIDKMRNKIRRASKGQLFIASDFEDVGSNVSVRKALSELVKSEELIRVETGIYQKPNYNDFLKIMAPPSMEELIKTYARKLHWNIAPSEDTALNILGLDTQVPNAYSFISDGPTKQITLRNRPITFRHVTVRESKLSWFSSTVIEAIKAIGENNITDEQLIKIRKKMTDTEYNRLIKESKSARVWVREAINQMGEKVHV
jgi:hypothetical protein